MTPLSVRSRDMAKSGMSGRNKYMVLQVRYVVIAMRSHIKGEWKSGQIVRSFGIGNIQYVNQTRPKCMKILSPA